MRSYANTHHVEYNEGIRQLKANMNRTKTNTTHYALAEYHISIITMNIDRFHKMIETEGLELRDDLHKDDEMVYGLNPSNIFLNIGCSYHNVITCDSREVARIITIQKDVAYNVRRI